MRNSIFFPAYTDKKYSNWGHDHLPNWKRFENGLNVPSVNISESEDKFLIELAAPGLTKEDFELKFEDGLLTISAQKEAQNDQPEIKYTRREYNFASFKRSFTIPQDVDNGAIKASYTDGILKVDLPKNLELIKNKVKTIEIA